MNMTNSSRGLFFLVCSIAASTACTAQKIVPENVYVYEDINPKRNDFASAITYDLRRNLLVFSYKQDDYQDLLMEESTKLIIKRDSDFYLENDLGIMVPDMSITGPYTHFGYECLPEKMNSYSYEIICEHLGFDRSIKFHFNKETGVTGFYMNCERFSKQPCYHKLIGKEGILSRRMRNLLRNH